MSLSPESETVWDKAGEYARLALDCLTKPRTKEKTSKDVFDTEFEFLRIRFLFPKFSAEHIELFSECRMHLWILEGLKDDKTGGNDALQQSFDELLEHRKKIFPFVNIKDHDNPLTPLQREIVYEKILGVEQPGP